MRRYILLALALVLFLPSHCQEIENPLEVSSASLNYYASGKINVSNTANNLEVEIHAVPHACESPGISYGEVRSDDGGGYLYQFYASRSSDVTWYITCAIEQSTDLMRFSSLYDFPYIGSYPSNVTQYTDFTSLVNHSDEIDTLASEIASGSNSDLEAAMRIAAWVNGELTYDLAYGDTIECATDVLAIKRGTCDEFVTLFMAMLRSLGIPARYVSGYAYGNIYGSRFNSHAWAEVYLSGRWVPIDPTYGEYGFVDAMHIPTYYAVDGNQSTIKTRWYPPGDVVIDRPAISQDIYVSDYAEFEETLQLSAAYSDTDLAIADYVLVTATVTNPTQYHIPATIGMSITNSTSIAYGQSKNYIVLPPDSQRTRYFIIRMDSCSAPLGYQCINPIELFVVGGQHNITELTVKPWLEPTTELNDLLMQVEMEQMSLRTGIQIINISMPHVFYSQPSAYIMVRNTGNTILRNLSVTFSYDSISKTIPLGDLLINGIADGQTVLPLPSSFGERPMSVIFLADNLTYQVNSTINYAEEPEISLSFTGNTTSYEFEPTMLSVQLTGECQNKSLTIITPNAVKQYVEDSYAYDVELPYDYMLPGANNMTFTVTCNDVLGTEFTFTAYVTINRVVTGFNIIIYWLLAFGRLLATLFDGIIRSVLSLFI